MKRCVFLAVFQLGLVLTPAARAAADDLPADAKEEIDQFRREAARIGEDAAAKLAAKKADLVKRLRTLQTKYTKEGKLDEAVAIRDRVRLLEGVSEMMRSEGRKETPFAALSRAVCGTVSAEGSADYSEALVLNLPGSPQGAVTSLRAVLPLVEHALQLLAGNLQHDVNSEQSEETN